MRFAHEILDSSASGNEESVILRSTEEREEEAEQERSEGNDATDEELGRNLEQRQRIAQLTARLERNAQGDEVTGTVGGEAPVVVVGVLVSSNPEGGEVGQVDAVVSATPPDGQVNGTSSVPARVPEVDVEVEVRTSAQGHEVHRMDEETDARSQFIKVVEGLEACDDGTDGHSATERIIVGEPVASRLGFDADEWERDDEIEDFTPT